MIAIISRHMKEIEETITELKELHKKGDHEDSNAYSTKILDAGV